MWLFHNEAIIIEGGGVSSLGRSAHLVSGSWWRVLGISLVYSLAVVGAWVLAMRIGSLNPVLDLVLFAGLFPLLTSVVIIGRTLLYIDLRARREGYSLDVLAVELDRPNFPEKTDSHIES